MSKPIQNILSLPKGMLLFLAIYALSFPALLVEHLAFRSNVIESWVGFSPALVWKGQLWRMASYALFSGSAIVWAVFLFWLVTLILILARDWSAFRFWIFCLFTAFAGAIPIALAFPRLDAPLLGAGAVVFGLLAAWTRLYGRERLIMIGLGEMSVRQAALIIAAIIAVISFFGVLPCGGIWVAFIFTFSLICGGLAGWAYLVIGDKRVMNRGSQVAESERIARLEL
jgi:membrane associated rhomboid family serine protease